MFYLNLILLLLIFLICYLTILRSYTKHQLLKFRSIGAPSSKTKDISFQKFISKVNFLKTKDLFLQKQGYPLKLDALRYYTLKFTLAAIFLIAGLKNYNSITLSIILSLIGFFFIDIYIMSNKKSRDAEIRSDLCSVVNSVSMQLSAHLSLKDSLKSQFINCKNKDFRKAMIEFSTCYELSELNIEKASNDLKNKFDILEVNMFCNALCELNTTGNVLEVLDNLSQTLSNKQVDRLKDITKSKILCITFGVLIALINIISLVFYPLVISLSRGFNNIFS